MIVPMPYYSMYEGTRRMGFSEKITSNEVDAYCHTHSYAQSPYLEKILQQAERFSPQAMMSSNRLSGGFLRTLTAMKQPKNILEIGLFFGYSTLCMAEGSPDSMITSLEWDGRYIEIAKDNFQSHPCTNIFHVIQGDATKTIEHQMQQTQFDFIFIDADKQNYPFYVSCAIAHLPSGGVLVVDNTLWGGKVLDVHTHNDPHTMGIDEANKMILTNPNMINTLIPIRDGMHVAVKR